MLSSDVLLKAVFATVLQSTLTERALELLALPKDGSSKLILDLGCGSGLSGEILTNEGHSWVVSIILVSNNRK